MSVMPAPLRSNDTRLLAWLRVLDAISEMRDALELRIAAETVDHSDPALEADCRVFCELTLALSDFLQARAK